MARALLREEQIGDIDNLSEPEHDVLVHENLVTSGTLNFQDGTISGTGDIYCDDLYASAATIHVGDGQIKSTAGSLEFYDDGVKVFETNSAGISVGTNSNSRLREEASVLYLDNLNAGESMQIRLQNGIDTSLETVFSATADGSSILYFNGQNKAETFGQGLYIVSTMTIYNDGAGDAQIKNTYDGGTIKLTGEVATDSEKTLASFDPAGAAALYHAGSVALNTLSTGIKISDSSSNEFDLYHSGTNEFRIVNKVTSGSIRMQGTNSSLSTVSVFAANPDGGTSLFESGVNTFQLTVAGGHPAIKLGTGLNGHILKDAAGPFEFRSAEASSTIVLSGLNGSSSLKSLFIGDPDGAAELYHAGEKQLETVVSGVEIPSDSFMYFGDTTTSGSWRMGISGEDFIHQKYDGSSWETKQTVVG